MNKSEQIDEYYIDKGQAIGRGEMGVVWPCQKQNESLKLCAKISTFRDEVRAEIEKEVQVLQQIQTLNNPNIIKIEKVILKNNELIVIMEKCETNLKNEMNRSFDEKDIEDFLMQIFNGCKGLYDKNIVHRDIKPENILISKNSGKNCYKLADFGTSKIVKQNDVLTTQVGTPVYGAPEMNRDHDEKDQKELREDMLRCQYKSQPDMFSLGIVLIQLVYGKSMFSHFKTIFQIIEFHNKLKNNQFVLPQKEFRNQKLKQAMEGMIQYWPSKRLTFEEIQPYLQPNECAQTLKNPAAFQQNQNQQANFTKQTGKINFQTWQQQNQQKPIDFNFQKFQVNQNLVNPQNQNFQTRIPEQRNNLLQFQDRETIQNSNNQIAPSALIPQKPPVPFIPFKLTDQSNGIQQQNFFESSSIIETRKKHFQPIIKYLEIQKYFFLIFKRIQTFQLYSQIIIQKLEKTMTYFIKEYNLRPNDLMDHVKTLKECYPYNSLDNTEFYITFQFSLLRLSNPQIQQNPLNIEGMKQILGNYKVSQ